MNTPTLIKISTADAINAFGSGAALARALNIKPQAITSWGEFVPELRAFQLREIRPEIFGKKSA